MSDIKLDFNQVLIKPKRSKLTSRNEVNLQRTWPKLIELGHNELSGTPIIAANMDHTGTMEMAKALARFQLFTALHKFYGSEELIDFYKNIGPDVSLYTFYTLGITDKDLKKYNLVRDTLGEAQPTLICIDVANGYSQRFAKFIEQFREENPKVFLMAGNVATPEMTEQLLLSGANMVKIGIGPGSVCTTRLKTGVGYPQLSAVIECADAAHGLDGLICSDGGCTNPGDVAKAFGANADFVMLGGMFAGHGECYGEIKNKTRFAGTAGMHNEKYMEFYGMSSETAMLEYYGEVAEHRTSEGKTVKVPYKGPVKDTILDILGGLRSSLTYVGAKDLKAFPRCVTFIQVSNQANDIF